MIEKIKKEIRNLTAYFNTSLDYDRYADKVETFIVVKRDEVFKILDKYDNQPDYKSAWEELKEKYIEYIDEYYNLFEDINELEQKYNLGGE